MRPGGCGPGPARAGVSRVGTRQRGVKPAPCVPIPIPGIRAHRRRCGVCRCAGCAGGDGRLPGEGSGARAVLAPRFGNPEMLEMSVHHPVPLARKAPLPRRAEAAARMFHRRTVGLRLAKCRAMCASVLRQHSSALGRAEKGRDKPWAVAVQG